VVAPGQSFVETVTDEWLVVVPFTVPDERSSELNGIDARTSCRCGKASPTARTT